MLQQVAAQSDYDDELGRECEHSCKGPLQTAASHHFSFSREWERQSIKREENEAFDLTVLLWISHLPAELRQDHFPNLSRVIEMSGSDETILLQVVRDVPTNRSTYDKKGPCWQSPL